MPLTGWDRGMGRWGERKTTNAQTPLARVLTFCPYQFYVTSRAGGETTVGGRRSSGGTRVTCTLNSSVPHVARNMPIVASLFTMGDETCMVPSSSIKQISFWTMCQIANGGLRRTHSALRERMGDTLKQSLAT